MQTETDIHPVQWIVPSQSSYVSDINPFGFDGDFLEHGWDALDKRIEDCRKRGINRAICQQIFGSLAGGDMQFDMWPRLVDFAFKNPRSETSKLASEAAFSRAVTAHIATGFELIGKVGTLRNVSYMSVVRLHLSTKPLRDNGCQIAFDAAATQGWYSITNGLLVGMSTNNKCYIEPWPTGQTSHMNDYPAFCLERYLTGKSGRPILEDGINTTDERMVILVNKDYPDPQAMARRANELIKLGITPLVASTQLKFNGTQMEAV